MLAVLLRLFDQMQGVRAKDLALAVGVDPGTITKWKKAVDEGRHFDCNLDQRAAIAELLLGEDEDDRLAGMEAVLEMMRATVADMDRAAMVRREIRRLAVTGGAAPGEEAEADDELVGAAMRRAREALRHRPRAASGRGDPPP